MYNDNMKKWLAMISLIFVVGMVHANSFTLSLDNDAFAGTDRDYTHATHLSMSIDETNSFAWIEAIVGDVTRKTHSVGQYMYTPSDISQTTVNTNERPYAGWLFYGYGTHAETLSESTTLELDFGVIGPWSLAGETQTWIHKITHSQTPMGWDHQISNRIALNATYQKRYRLARYEDYFDLVGYGGGAAGNVSIMGNLGFVTRAGWNVPMDFGTVRLEPVPRATGSILDAFSLYGIVLVEDRLVGYNAFLEGVETEPLVCDFLYGIGGRIYGLDIVVSRTYRSKEYTKQKDYNSFGSVTVTYSW